jgi:hypothetical protein
MPIFRIRNNFFPLPAGLKFATRHLQLFRMRVDPFAKASYFSWFQPLELRAVLASLIQLKVEYILQRGKLNRMNGCLG